MARWTEEQKLVTSFIVTGEYMEFYTSATTILSGYAGKLSPNTVVYVEYDEEYDAMKITNCYDTRAIGKYLLRPYNQDGSPSLEAVDKKAITEAKTTTSSEGLKVPENTDANGNTSGSTTWTDPFHMDDAFITMEYSKTYKSNKEYADNLQKGLRVQDLRGILGMPHQFLPTADPRLDAEYNETTGLYGIGDNNGFGRVYSEKIIKHIPLLLMTPGTPSFMASFSKNQRNIMIGALKRIIPSTDLDSIFNDGTRGKYYSLKYAYAEYFHYVNAMLRSAAYFLEIQDKEVDGKRLGSTDWLWKTTGMGSEIFSNSKLENFLGPYAGSLAFYVDGGTTVDDSFSNNTSESQLSSTLNSVSETGRELNFLIGNVGGLAGVRFDALDTSATLEQAVNDINKKIGPGNILSNILSKSQTILAGGRLVFPEIWSDSSFSRSYSCSMKLVSPSGDKLSVYLNILVPIYHLLAFTLPREATNQAYFSPFLVRAYYKGLFNVDMGIIPSLSITKGDEGEWTVDGIPTVANVNFEIKDLYDGMYMSKYAFDRDFGLMSNIQELDYIANSCGINVNDQEIMRTVKMYMALGFTNVKDKVTIGIFGQINQYFNQKMQNIFGVFR